MQIPAQHSLPSASRPHLQNRLIMAACLSGVKALREGLGWGDCEGAAGAAGEKSCLPGVHVGPLLEPSQGRVSWMERV